MQYMYFYSTYICILYDKSIGEADELAPYGKRRNLLHYTTLHYTALQIHFNKGLSDINMTLVLLKLSAV